MTAISRKRIVITGINGFVGHHLARKLHENNTEVIGIGQDDKVTQDLSNIVNEYHSANLVTTWPIIANVDAVIHLAGLAAVGPSFDNPQQYITSNSAMVTNMCEYFLAQKKKPRILIVSSGAVYKSDQEMPITEDSQLGFSSPYAVSKILTENQCAYYRNRGLDCIIVRPFNHIGPGQGKGFILPDFYERLSHADSTAIIKVGNIDTKRDYTDVRDIVNAYIKIANAPSVSYDIYNICSGVSISGKEILGKLKSLMNKPSIQLMIDPSLIRPTDAKDIYGTPSRLEDEFGWRPAYSIDDAIKDFIANKKREESL